MFILNQRGSPREAGVAQVLLLVLLLGGVLAGTYLVQQRTNLFPQAFQKDKYYLEQYPSKDIILSLSPVTGVPSSPKPNPTSYPETVPGGGISSSPMTIAGDPGGEGGIPTPPDKVDGLIYVLLKDKNGNEVKAQNLSYNWSIGNPEIASITPHGKCKVPSTKGQCPKNYSMIKPLKLGETEINVTALRRNKVLATATFNLTVTDKKVTCKTDKDCQAGYACYKIYGDSKGCFDNDPETKCEQFVTGSCQPKPSPSCVPAPDCVYTTNCEIAPAPGTVWCPKPTPYSPTPTSYSYPTPGTPSYGTPSYPTPVTYGTPTYGTPSYSYPTPAGVN